MVIRNSLLAATFLSGGKKIAPKSPTFHACKPLGNIQNKLDKDRMYYKSTIILLISFLISSCKTTEISVFLKRYDLYGPVKSYHITTFSLTELNGKMIIGQKASFYPYDKEKKIEFDNKGNQTLLIEYDLNGNISYENRMVWDGNENLIYDVDKRFRDNDTSSIYSKHITYDSIGREILISQFDKEGQLFNQRKLIYKDKQRTKVEIYNAHNSYLKSYFISKYDSLDRLVTYTTYKVFTDTIRHDSFVYDNLLGKFMHVIIDDRLNTYTSYKYKYDDDKRLIERQYLYKDSIFGSTFFNYNADNILIREITKRNDTIFSQKKFDLNGKCIYDSCEFYFWTKTYDKKGNLLEYTEFNVTGKPYSKNLFNYDKNGTLRKEVGLYLKDSLNGNNGPKRYILLYDKYGNLTNENWLYMDGTKQTEKRVYTMDRHKNWTKLIRYQNDSATHIVDRKISYY